MSSDIRAALERLVSAYKECSEHYEEIWPQYLDGPMAAARAALAAAPEGQPSDQELRDLWSWSSGQDQGPWPTQYHCFARAVLARWGRPAALPAPAEGEVGELVAWLQSLEDASIWFETGSPEDRKRARAADLLQQLSAAAPAVVPIPMNERPGPKDCDAEGRCWLCYTNACNVTQWSLVLRSAILDWPISHWLPAHAIPLPQGGEVEG